MKIKAVFETDSAPRIELIPETPQEQLLLGSVLGEDVHGRVHVAHEGHHTHRLAKIVSITLKDGKL